MKPSSKRIPPDHKPSGGGASAPASTLKLVLYYRLPWFALCLFIFWQSSFDFMDSPPLFPHDDKVKHLMAYAFLAFLIARNLKKERSFLSPTKLRLLAILFASIYGLSDEIHQAFVPSRDASMPDFAADILGSFIGAWFYLNFFCRRK